MITLLQQKQGKRQTFPHERERVNIQNVDCVKDKVYSCPPPRAGDSPVGPYPPPPWLGPLRLGFVFPGWGPLEPGTP